VVGAVAGDDLEAPVVAALGVVLAGELEGHLVGFRPGVGEQHRPVAAEEVGQALGQRDRRRVGLREREERELLELRRGRLGQLVAPVAGVHAPLPAHPVQVAIALHVRDPGALPGLDDRRIRPPDPAI
jgi:hypothetical protein